MARALGRAFKITGKDVSGYGYAKPRRAGMRPNPPPVTTIAAINGRGAYAGRSARSVMSGLSPAARLRRAKALTANERSAFASRMRAAKQRRFGRTPNVNWRGVGQSAGHVAGRAWHGTKRLGHATAAGVGAGWRAGRAAHAGYRTNRFRPPVRHFSRFGTRRFNGPRAKARGRLHRRNTTMSLGKHRRMRRNKQKRGRKLSGAAKRAFLARMASGRRKRRANPKRRTHKAKRRTHKRRHAKRRVHNRRRRSKAKRRTHKRRSNRRRARRHNAKRRSHKRRHRAKRRSNRRHAKRHARRSNRRRARRSNRRHAKRHARRSNRHYADNRRRSRRRNRKHRARRRNARRGFFAKLFKKNGAFGDLATTFTTGAFVVAGFAGHKVATKLLSDFVLDKLFGAPATPVAPPTPPATSGLDALRPYKSLIAGGVSALLGAVAVNMLVKDVRARMLIGGGVAASFLHTVLVTGLTQLGQPKAAGYLSGVDDGTAAQLSAMYGLGAGTSIMPQYAMINGLGEYFGEQPINGLGEYFGEQVSPVHGVGEYFGEQPIHGLGLGQYTSNPDLAEASAGFGDITPPGGSDHVNPNGDLDRELSIAEAAAGVGAAVYSQEASAGFGAIDTLARRDTWVPGMQNPQLWAGVRGITRGQSATETTTAGILQTSAGSGVFG